MSIYNIPMLESGMEWIKRGIWGTANNNNIKIGDVLLFRCKSHYVAIATVASSTINDTVTVDGITSNYRFLLKDIEIIEPKNISIELLKQLGLNMFQRPMKLENLEGNFLLQKIRS